MIGDKIKERRIELGLTQAQLSKETGIKSTTISNYENNISSPSEENIFKFMEVLKCDANYLFEWEEVNDIKLSFSEKAHIKKYRNLDKYGKQAIDELLEIEYKRCTEQSQQTAGKMLTAKIAAYGGDNSEKQISEDELRNRFKALRDKK